MNNKSYLLCVLFIFLTYQKISAQDTIITVNASYIGDALYNMSGGIKTEGGYLGYAKIGLLFDTEKSHLWKGGSFYIGGANTHGISPSETIIGDYQVVDNIEAGNHTFIEYLWFQQNFGKFSVKVGFQDLNENFAVCDAAGHYINSSFGIHSTLSCNFTVPIFPITSLGMELHYNINKSWYVQLAVYDGDMPSFEDNNTYNTNWSLSKEDGALFIGEGQYFRGNGAYKIGGFYHSEAKSYGVFACFEQAAWENNRHKLTPFIQTGLIFNKKDVDNYLHIGGGLNLEGVFSKNDKDEVGVAFTSAVLSNNNDVETAIEMFYKYKITDNFMIQPDFQYVINPLGKEKKLDNAFIGILRFCFEI